MEDGGGEGLEPTLSSDQLTLKPPPTRLIYCRPHQIMAMHIYTIMLRDYELGMYGVK